MLRELQRRYRTLEDEPFGLVCPSTLARSPGRPQGEWIVVYRYADHSKTDIAADEETNRRIGPVGRAVAVPASEPPHMKHTGWSLGRVDKVICR